MSTIVFLPNYFSGKVKTSSIQPVSACLAACQAQVKQKCQTTCKKCQTS